MRRPNAYARDSFSVCFTERIICFAGNKLLYGAGVQKVMVVGGPNVRKDYHIEIGEVRAALGRNELQLAVW